MQNIYLLPIQKTLKSLKIKCAAYKNKSYNKKQQQSTQRLKNTSE